MPTAIATEAWSISISTGTTMATTGTSIPGPPPGNRMHAGTCTGTCTRRYSTTTPTCPTFTTGTITAIEGGRGRAAAGPRAIADGYQDFPDLNLRRIVLLTSLPVMSPAGAPPGDMVQWPTW